MALLAPVVLVLFWVAAAVLMRRRRARKHAELALTAAMPSPPTEPVAPPRMYGAETGDVEVDIADLVVDAADRFVPRAQQARVELVVLVDDTVSQALWGPTGPVHRLLVNFISNAIALTEKGSVTVIATAVDGPADQTVVRFSVSDGGSGHCRDDALTFFEPYDVDAPCDEGRFGWAESCRLIDEMDGSRGVIGRPGVGSTVWFTVPFRTFGAPITAALAPTQPVPPPVFGPEFVPEVQPESDPVPEPVVSIKAEPEAIVEPEPEPESNVCWEPEPEAIVGREPEPEPEPIIALEPEPEPEPVPKRRGNLLVADDNAVNRRVTTVMLQRTGYQVEVVTDGLEAVRVLAQRRFDAVIMDCRMPRMDGLEATGQIRAAEGRRRHTPIIALTAATNEGDRAAAMAAGMDDYLVKPVAPQDLLDSIDRWVPRPAAAGVGSGSVRP